VASVALRFGSLGPSGRAIVLGSVGGGDEVLAPIRRTGQRVRPILRNMTKLKADLNGFNPKQWLSKTHGVAILDEDLDYFACLLGLNLVKDFHGFDHADDRIRFYD